jgi:hypothetical protein
MYPFQSTDPRDARFLSFPGINFNDPGVQLAGLAGLGVAALAAGNVINGNDDLKIRPNLVVNYDPQSGALSPALSANVQVGNGPVAPSINVGGQLDNSGIAPIIGTGINVGEGNGFNPALTSNFALKNGQAKPQFGVGANVGGFNLGNIFGR